MWSARDVYFFLGSNPTSLSLSALTLTYSDIFSFFIVILKALAYTPVNFNAFLLHLNLRHKNNQILAKK